MLNLLGASGHKNYSKNTRLYLQAAAALEKDHPDIYQQFLWGNHTVRCANNNWSGIWTNLSIEQILMEFLKGRSDLIVKGYPKMWCMFEQKQCIGTKHILYWTFCTELFLKIPWICPKTSWFSVCLKFGISLMTFYS